MINPINYRYQKYLQEKKRVDNLQSAIEVAEDHAYLAGQETMREQMIEKAVEWLNNFYSEDRHCFLVKEDIEAFKQAMEE